MKKILMLAAFIVISASSTAFSHSMIKMTYPQDRTLMKKQAERLELKFENPVRLVNLKLLDSTSKPVAIDFQRQKEAKAHFTITTPTLKPDNYTVHWKAMGDDGHMMKGSFGFMQH